MENGERKELNEKNRSQGVELRFNIIRLLLTAFIVMFMMIGFAIIQRYETDKIKEDNHKTRLLICRIVEAIPNFPKTPDCREVKERSVPTSSNNPNDPDDAIASSNQASDFSEDFNSVFLLPASPRAKTTLPTPPPEEQSLSTPIRDTVETVRKPVTKVDELTGLTLCQYPGDNIWVVGEVC